MEDLSGALLLFFITALISSYGSLQLGPVNGGVLRYCFQGRFKSALWLAVGGSLTEIPFAVLALFGSGWLNRIAGLDLWMNRALVPTFLLLGIRMLITSRKNPVSGEERAPLVRNPILEGIGLASLNPQLPLFWLTILIWMKGSLGLYPESLIRQLAFVLGTAAGAFYLLWLLIRIAMKNRSRLRELSERYNTDRLIAWFFIALALIQAIRLVFF